MAQRQRFLVVDDYPTMRRIVVNLLQEAGFSDIVEAEARKADILQAASLGAAGYVVKPFTRAVLESKVLSILRKQGH